MTVNAIRLVSTQLDAQPRPLVRISTRPGGNAPPVYYNRPILPPGIGQLGHRPAYAGRSPALAAPQLSSGVMPTPRAEIRPFWLVAALLAALSCLRDGRVVEVGCRLAELVVDLGEQGENERKSTIKHGKLPCFVRGARCCVRVLCRVLVLVPTTHQHANVDWARERERYRADGGRPTARGSCRSP